MCRLRPVMALVMARQAAMMRYMDAAVTAGVKITNVAFKGKGVYLEIVAPVRIVYKVSISDEQGNLRDPKDMGMDPEWPAETIVTATFKEMGMTTKFTLHQTVSQTIAKRTGAFPSWLSAFDLLDELLKKQIYEG